MIWRVYTAGGVRVSVISWQDNVVACHARVAWKVGGHSTNIGSFRVGLPELHKIPLTSIVLGYILNCRTPIYPCYYNTCASDYI